MNESSLKRKILAMIKKKYPHSFVYKTSDRFTSGIPDILMCLNGWFVGIELKATGKKPSPLQIHVINKIREARGVAIGSDSFEEICMFLEKVSEFLKEGR